MTDKRKLVMATNNAGKLREARAIAGDKLEILSLSDIGYNHDIPETADTLEGNALIKVRAIKDVCDLDVFADDTGLMVDALGGAPGVYSARYAGEGCSPDDNIELMLKNMDGVENRHARFRTCIALSLNGEEHIFEGSVEGRIAKGRSGSHGFGYDPIFISEETGKCFAEMSDEEKNAISHRGRAITAMMKWLSALCVAIFAFLPAKAALTSDWMLFNTFDDNIEKVFDTVDKTYILAKGQLYDKSIADNNERVCFLFCLDKETDELRQYNAQNFLSGNIISIANYNAIKKYLFIVYDDFTIDILYDNGEIYTISGLKNFSVPYTKNVRSISFDPERNRAYVATDFGFIAINDQKHEIASSGIYKVPIDYVARVADNLLIVSDGKILRDDANANHASISDFKETSWAEGETVMSLIPLSSSKCLFSKKHNGEEAHYILSFVNGESEPTRSSIGSFAGASIVENKDGILLTRTSQIVGIDRETGDRTFVPRRPDGEDYAVPVGSWDLYEAVYAKPREGVYSLRRNDNNEWSITRQLIRPNAPSVFRSNFMRYSGDFGMLVCSHGIDQNFTAHAAPNPLLLSALNQGEWISYGIPYFDVTQRLRLVNPSGFAQDPDTPDVFYFGSIVNGLIRYSIKDYENTVLHMTRSNDSPSASGHISVREPYADWGNVFMLMNPRFDKNGNLLIAHCNTDLKKYTSELWIWTPEKRKATVSPETFQPFKILKIEGVTYSKSMLALPLETTPNLVPFMIFNSYQEPFVIYDHNGTPEDESDDRQVAVRSLFDNDGKVSYNYLYCAIEDPSTGLVWVGSDNGVFTIDPKEQFTNTGKVNRIKVSRNDGTSLADYLLDGISINNISIDNNGRKWFSLNGGGVVCTSSDGRNILQEITSDNSMLPSDKIYATCYNPDSNSMMMATENGLCEYYLSQQGTSSSSEPKARAYPNPVRPDYYGWVTIDGLEEDCLVKITDSAGNLIRELGPATGGSVQWDACNANLDRVASGVYFVLASASPNGSSYSEVAKILVVKN